MNPLLLIFLLVAGCASAPRFEDHNPLVKAILGPRKGYKTLVNQVIQCDKAGCHADVKEYDLNDINVRHTLKELGFRCDIGGKAYFICENGPGFCRREYDILHKFLGIVTKREAVFAPAIDINDRYDFLLDARARCQSHQALKN
jgi:hypothetical protein